MLSSITSYLIQYKQVFIPSVGTFKLRYQPARLHFADRLIHPPGNEIIFVEEGSITKEQIAYLCSHLGIEVSLMEQKLISFGQALKADIVQTAFQWNGVGQLKWMNDSVVFEGSQTIPLSAVAANKIIRQNAHHDVLVGEKEMHSSDTSYLAEPKSLKRSYAIIIGWIVVLLAISFIIYHLYQKNFHPFASGLQKPVSHIFYNL